MNQVSAYIIKARERHKLNKSQAADRLGISSQLLGQYESGKRIPKTQFFLKWKEVFGDDLMQQFETNVSHETKQKTEPPPEHIWDMREDLRSLTESTRKLSDSNLINAKNIDRLITLLERKYSNSGEHEGSPLTSPAILPRLLVILAEIGSGKKWKSVDEAIAALHKSFGDVLLEASGAGIQIG